MKVRSALATLLATVIPVLTALSAVTHARQAFGDEPSRELVVPAFADAEVASLLATLDTRLASATSGGAADDVKSILADFGRRLQMGRLTTGQETLVLRHLDDVSRARPEAASFADLTERVIRTLTIGKTAPDIIGTDLDGQEFRLSDYRGKVVALVFSGEWCGICRSEYPYEHFLLEQYKNWPFAMLSVNSDADPDTAKRAYAARGLTFRSWFDGDGQGGPKGPIAAAWNVNGWPTAYLIDGRGVIRFVNLRQEDLLKGVRQLLVEQAQLAARDRRQ
jgi:peroxiredoxin